MNFSLAVPDNACYQRANLLILSTRKICLFGSVERVYRIYSEGKIWILAGQMDNLPWHYSCSSCVRISWVFGQEIYQKYLHILFARLFLWFWAISKIEPEEICWRPATRDYITKRYFGKRVPRIFPALAPSSHEYIDLKMEYFEYDTCKERLGKKTFRSGN